MKKHFLLSCAALALALPSHAQDYPSLSLKMAHPLAQTFPGAEWDKWFAEEIERRSGGKIKIQIFWSGQLGGLTEIKNLVLLNRVSADAKTGSELARASYASKTVSDELQAQNLRVIKWTVPSPYKLLCNKAINTSADLKGLKVRAVGGAYVPIWMEAYGMVPTRVQATEIREGLQRGTLDCNFGPIEWTPFSDLQKVAPYLSDLNTGSFTTFQMYVPAKTYNAWPRSVQTLFTQVAQEAMQKDLAALPKVEADAIEKFKATGGSIVAMKDLQNFIARSPDMIQIWVDKSTKDGLGEKIKELIPLQRKAAQSFANSRN